MSQAQTSQAQTSRAQSSSSRTMRPAAVLLAIASTVGLAPMAHAQVQTVARVAADTDQFGGKATDSALSVGTVAIVVVGNHGVTMLDKGGTVLAAHKSPTVASHSYAIARVRARWPQADGSTRAATTTPPTIASG